MPQHAGRILQYAYIDSNIRRFILDSWPRMPFLNVEQFPQLTEAGETPVAFLGDKPMMSIYRIVLLLHQVIWNYATYS